MALASRDPLASDLAKTDVWLADLCRELGDDNRRYAWGVMGGFLHALRDRLSGEEVFRFGAALPGPLRGVLYEGWWPGQRPEAYRDAEAFTARVAQCARLMGGQETSAAIDAAWAVLTRRVPSEDLAAVLAALPDEVSARMTRDTLRSR